MRSFHHFFPRQAHFFINYSFSVYLQLVKVVFFSLHMYAICGEIQGTNIVFPSHIPFLPFFVHISFYFLILYSKIPLYLFFSYSPMFIPLIGFFFSYIYVCTCMLFTPKYLLISLWISHSYVPLIFFGTSSYVHIFHLRKYFYIHFYLGLSFIRSYFYCAS